MAMIIRSAPRGFARDGLLESRDAAVEARALHAADRRKVGRPPHVG